MHLNKILFTHDRFDDKPQIICNGVSKTLAHDLTRILDRKFDLQILIPVRVNFEFSFSNPFCVILVNADDFKFMVDIEFFEPGPDCKGDMASFRIEKHLAAQFIGLFGGGSHNMFPRLIV